MSFSDYPGPPSYPVAAEHQIARVRSGCMGRIFGLILALVILVITLAAGLIPFAIMVPEVQGHYAVWRHGGVGPFICDGNDDMLIKGHTIVVKSGTAVVADGNCHIRLVDCEIKGTRGISARGNAQVTVVGGSVQGKKYALEGQHNARITVADTKVKGKRRTSELAEIEGLDD